MSSKPPKVFARNYIWIACNYSLDSASLSKHEIFQLTYIFTEFIEQGDEDMLAETAKGLAKLAGSNDPAIIEIVAAKHTKLITIMSDLLCHKN